MSREPLYQIIFLYDGKECASSKSENIQMISTAPKRGEKIKFTGWNHFYVVKDIEREYLTPEGIIIRVHLTDKEINCPAYT